MANIENQGSDEEFKPTAIFKWSFIMVLVTFVTHVVGFSTHYWTAYGYTDHVDGLYYEEILGLWKACGCVPGDCICVNRELSIMPAFFKAVVAMECIGLVCLTVSMFVCLQAFFTGHLTPNMEKASAFVVLVGGLAILAGSIVYGVKVKEGLHYSFGLCTVAGVLCLACFSLLMTDRSRTQHQKDLHNRNAAASVQFSAGATETTPPFQLAGGRTIDVKF